MGVDVCGVGGWGVEEGGGVVEGGWRRVEERCMRGGGGWRSGA